MNWWARLVRVLVRVFKSLLWLNEREDYEVAQYKDRVCVYYVLKGHVKLLFDGRKKAPPTEVSEALVVNRCRCRGSSVGP